MDSVVLSRVTETFSNVVAAGRFEQANKAEAVMRRPVRPLLPNVFCARELELKSTL